MAEPLHLKDAVAQWWQGAGEKMNIRPEVLNNLHTAIWAGRAEEQDLEAARRIVDGELQRFAMLLDRIDERQGKTFRRNQRTFLQKVRALLGYTYP